MAADEAASPPATGAIAVAALSADEAASPPATGAIAVTTGPCDPRSTDATKSMPCQTSREERKSSRVGELGVLLPELQLRPSGVWGAERRQRPAERAESGACSTLPSS